MKQFSLECFIAVADTQSFTRAAEQVSRTQSAVTQQINKLEIDLKKRLFNRSKEITLTPDGELLLSYAKRMQALEKELVDRFKNPELEGEVSIGLPEDFAALFLSDILADFMNLHPRIILNVDCDLTINLFEKFKRKELDMVLVKMSQPEDFPYGVEVWSEPLEWVATPTFRAEELSRRAIPLLLTPKPCVYRQIAIEALEGAEIKWRAAFSSPSYVGVMSALRASLGVSIMPKTMIPKELKVLKSSILPKLPEIHVSLLKNDKTNPILSSLESFLLEKLGRRSMVK